jgi:hypothetical protein
MQVSEVSIDTDELIDFDREQVSEASTDTDEPTGSLIVNNSEATSITTPEIIDLVLESPSSDPVAFAPTTADRLH